MDAILENLNVVIILFPRKPCQTHATPTHDRTPMCALCGEGDL